MKFHARVWISRIADALDDIFPELHREILKYYGMISVHHLEKLYQALVTGGVSPRTPKKTSREPPSRPAASSSAVSAAPKTVTTKPVPLSVPARSSTSSSSPISLGPEPVTHGVPPASSTASAIAPTPEPVPPTLGPEPVTPAVPPSSSTSSPIAPTPEPVPPTVPTPTPSPLGGSTTRDKVNQSPKHDSGNDVVVVNKTTYANVVTGLGKGRKNISMCQEGGNQSAVNNDEVRGRGRGRKNISMNQDGAAKEVTSKDAQGTPVSPSTSINPSSPSLSPNISKRGRDESENEEEVEESSPKKPRETPRYSLKLEREVESKRFRAKEKWYRVEFEDDSRGSLAQILQDLDNVLEEVMNNALDDLQPRDHVRFVLMSPQLENPIAIPWVLARDMSVEEMLKAIENVLQSNEEFYLHSGVSIVIKHINIPVGGRVNSVKVLDSREWVKQCKGMLSINNNDDDMCFARAVITAMGRPIRNVRKGHPQWSGIKAGGPVLTTMAKELHAKAGIAEGTVSAEDFDKFQDILAPYVRLVVYGLRGMGGVIYEGPPAEHSAYLFYHHNHFDVITSPAMFVNRNYFCEACLTGYNNLNAHLKCTMGNSDTAKCPQCLTSECNARVPDQNAQGIWLKCRDCFRSFKTQRCYDLHRDVRFQTCTKYYICGDCKMFVYKEKLPKNEDGEFMGHSCSDYHCQTCSKYVTHDHNCCMIPPPFPDYKKPIPYIFFDYECTQNNCGKHEPNLVVAQFTCTRCLDLEDKIDRENVKREKTGIPKLSKAEIDNCDICLAPLSKREVVFTNEVSNCNDAFCYWLFNLKQHKGATVLAHNNSGYDIYFIIKYMLENGVCPTNVIRSGGKVRQMIEPNSQIRFIDSLSFLPMSLAKLPKTFGFTELKKGYFPFFFNTAENFNFIGNLPSREDYGIGTMMPDARIEFEKWYAGMIVLQEKGEYVFNMKEEIVAYCKSDVDILSRSCSEFRRLFMQITARGDFTGIDPFRQSTTLASVCNLLYRTLFMRKDEIAIIPPQGYSPKRNQSVKGLRWLHTLRVLHNCNIQDALHGGEFYVNGVGFVDGIDVASNTVYEMQGCFFHGCRKCYGHTTQNRLLRKSMGQLHQETLNKLESLKNLGFEVKVIWEHEYDQLMKTNPEFKKAALECNLNEPLQPRDAFFGGRTNSVRLFYVCKEGEKIKYVDVTSLYPFIQKYRRFPTGQPVIIREDFETIDKYFGLIKCKVLPPTSLKLPLLPKKGGGKLLFPLCTMCAESEQTTLCQHSDQERALEGTWVSVELIRAVELGYKILEISEVWHFPNSSKYCPETGEKGIFSEYIDAFLKIKQECSDWPEHVITDADKAKYVKDYFEVEGIQLDPTKIGYNPGLRAVAKNCLNNLWGRFGMRDNLPKTEFINSPARLFEVIGSDEIELSDLNIYNDMFAEISYTLGDNFVKPNLTTNSILASFVTAHARIYLYSILEKLDDRVLYFDTDSCVYIEREGEWTPPLGPYLGDLTNEISPKDGSYIETFVGAGPKNYAYQLDSGKTVVKIRGITLNSSAIRVVNFDTVANMVKGIGPDVVTVHNPHKIVRDYKNKEIITKSQNKDYRVVYTKRIIIDDYKTVPYGYRPPPSL